MNCLAIIPARGGSKRLPRKNIIEFLGRPIIAHTIEAALQSACFSRVIVSTDDVEIAEISARYHHDWVMRPAALATDEARVADVCEHLLREEAEQGRTYDVLSVLYATAPLRTADDIRSVVSYVQSKKYTSAMAVTSYSLPVHQALICRDSGVEMVFPDIFFRRSNELPEYCVDNGSTYAVTTEFFLKAKELTSPNLAVHMMPRSRSVDIDTWDDYLLANCLAQKAEVER